MFKETGIYNGHPWTRTGRNCCDDELLGQLSDSDQKIVLDWIAENIVPRVTPNRHHSSYGIKHILEQDTGIYLTNNQFKDAMLEAGYMPTNTWDLNWMYRISQKSKAFHR